MNMYSTIAQIIIAISIGYVWIFRFDNIVKEFEQYGLSDLTRTMVGAAKIILATLLIVGIWHSEFILIPSVLIGLLMIAAQYFHFKVKNPIQKHLPSLFLLSLCIVIVLISIN